jgi:hypothetical protein
MIEFERLKPLLEKNNIPADMWYTASLPETPVQIYDRTGGRYHAIINRNDCCRIRVYDREYCRNIIPVVDTGWDPISAAIKKKMLGDAAVEKSKTLGVE